MKDCKKFLAAAVIYAVRVNITVYKAEKPDLEYHAPDEQGG